MPIQNFVFPNGFRIVYEKPKNKLPITSIQVFCDVGSVHEHDDLRGVSHFIEHMCFKGTHDYLNSKKLLIEFDKMGADFNAYTEKRFTCYHVKIGNDSMQNCIQLISDMLMNSTFIRKEYDKEYKVVVEENIKNENDPEVIVDENMDKLLYKGSSFEYEIDNLRFHKKKMNYEKVMEYYKSFYIPTRFVLSIVSNVPFETIKTIIQKSYFMKNVLPNNGYILHRNINFNIEPQNKIQYLLQKKVGIVTNLLMIGFRTCSDLSKDKYALNLLRKMMNDLSGKLSMLLREDNGLTYTSYASTNYYEHIGDFILFAETDSKKLIKNGSSKGVLPLIIGLINDLLEHGITDKEVQLSKNSKKEKMKLKLEDNDVLAEHNGKEFLLYGDKKKIISFSDIYETHYKDITKQNINEVIRKYFKPENMSVCIIGEQIPSQSTIEKECSKIIKI
jgi:predicted Zn-dependent peptidase